MTAKERPYLPIAIGFYLLGLPLWGIALYAATRAEAWTDAISGAVLVVCGLLLHWRAR